jgi:hypothetical protein
VITTIVHFEVPAENIEQFFSYWQDHIKDEVGKQPGLIDGIFYRCIDPESPFQFVNVAHWESAERLVSALSVSGEDLPEMGDLFRDLGVKVSQNNYVEAVRYTPSRVHA